MKIGFSFGRGIRDIVNGEISINDVLVIVTRTHIEAPEKLEGVVRAYMHRPDYLMGLDADRCLEVALELWESGKLHQPRAYGATTTHISEGYVWMDVIPTAQDMDPGVKEAWEAYRMLLVMRGNAIPDPSCR